VSVLFPSGDFVSGDQPITVGSRQDSDLHHTISAFAIGPAFRYQAACGGLFDLLYLFYIYCGLFYGFFLFFSIKYGLCQ